MCTSTITDMPVFAENAVARLYIGYCRANHNPGDAGLDTISGSGIEVFNASDATIEYCEAGYNGGDQPARRGNGPVGIWIAFSRDVTIQYCIAHHNTNSTGDGGGIDLDSESHDNVVQYNYCYENKNYGIQLWQWSGQQWLEKNVIRYNIFDNVRANRHAPSGLAITMIPRPEYATTIFTITWL